MWYVYTRWSLVRYTSASIIKLPALATREFKTRNNEQLNQISKYCNRSIDTRFKVYNHCNQKVNHRLHPFPNTMRFGSLLKENNHTILSICRKKMKTLKLLSFVSSEWWWIFHKSFTNADKDLLRWLLRCPRLWMKLSKLLDHWRKSSDLSLLLPLIGWQKSHPKTLSKLFYT